MRRLDGFAAGACAPEPEHEDEVCNVDAVGGDINAIESAMPHAIQRVVSPRTAEGRVSRYDV